MRVVLTSWLNSSNSRTFRLSYVHTVEFSVPADSKLQERPGYFSCSTVTNTL
jgi:hypothetical protein